MNERSQDDVETLFKKHYREFCLLAYSYVSCLDLAQDVVQDIFVQILTHDKSVEISNLKGYIWRSVKYASLKQVRDSRKLASINEYILSFPLSDEEERFAKNPGPKLRSAIDNLPEQCKKVFELCALDGQKYRTAANSLGISVNTVKTQMKKAYRILRYDLRNLYGIVPFFSIIHQILP